MDLFEHRRTQQQPQEAPLAARMRPCSFEEFLGQEHLVGSGKILRSSIEADQVPSMILWGPPGSGKTTLAFLIASVTRSHFAPVSAVTSGVAELRRIIQEARDRRSLHGQRTILFIDELHRFNKAQQDVILPHVEDGTVTLVGATTENPSFEVVSPLLSRSKVYALYPLSDEHIRTVVEEALKHRERGLGKLNVGLMPEALEFLVMMANGDARVALNALELAATAVKPQSNGQQVVDLATMEDVLQKKAILYDKGGDLHYDLISAFIKSLRGSDPDAAIYWLARMLEGSEDPLFIVRRLVILAAEDVGLADPQALTVAVAAQQAVHFIGMPEAALPLAEATLYLATAPKSNSGIEALIMARKDVNEERQEPVPLHLRNATTRLMQELGYGREYKYAHRYPDHFVEQQYLPTNLSGRHYYRPSELGYEREIADRLRQWSEKRGPTEEKRENT